MLPVTDLLQRMSKGDREASAQLLPLVYEELKRLAAAKLRREAAGHTLQATALVHEAYLRLVGADTQSAEWDGLQHFLGAAAEAMQRVLVDHARRKQRLKRGGGRKRQALEDVDLSMAGFEPREDIIALDAALTRLAMLEPTAAELVRLRYFVGLTNAQTAVALGISTRTADRVWSFARSWLFAEMKKSLKS